MMTWILLLGTTLAAEVPMIRTMETGINIWDVATHDLNGDGKSEILALSCDEKSYPLNKCIAVFVAAADGSYPGTPSCTLPLDPKIGCVFFAEVDGNAPVEMVAATAEGATVFHYAGGGFTPKEEPRFASLLPTGSKEPLFLGDVAQDLNGDGIDEWLIPAPSGYEIRSASGLVRKLDCDVVSEIRSGDSMTITHRLPAHHVMTIAGQSQKEVAFLSDEFADFWYGTNWSEHRRFKIPLNLDEKWEANAKMVDINDDGLPDLVVSQTRGTVNIQAQTQVYLASGPFTYPEAPSARFEAKGAVTSPMLIDVNGDKKADLMLITVPIGIKFFMNYFMLGKLSLQVEVYLFNGTSYGAKPDFRTNLSFDAPEGRERGAYAMGDFNGDGYIDAAFGAGSDKMVINTGGKTQFLSPRPWLKLDLPPFGTARAVDLNQDKKQELLLFHPGGEHGTEMRVVFF